MATKVRLQKVGQHKLGSSSYMNLQSRLIIRSNEISYLFFYIILQTILFNETIHGKLTILSKNTRHRIQCGAHR